MIESTYRKLLSAAKLLLLLIIASVGASHPLWGQRDPSASKSADISVYVGFTNSDSDFELGRNNGGTGGLTYTRYLRWRVAPAFDVRVDETSGPNDREESVLAGLRLVTQFGRFHPYANALVGGTEIFFKAPPNPFAVHPYTHDRAFAKSIGGGVNIDVFTNYQLMLDYQEQFLNFGGNGELPNNADFTLTPSFATIGVVYRIPFHAHKNR